MGPERRDFRDRWLKAALDLTRKCDLIFVDPDNGLEVPSVGRLHKKGPKYTYFEELRPYRERGQSLVIYHHLCRNGKALDQIKQRVSQIKEQLNVDDVYALRYHCGTARVFFVVPSPKHSSLLETRVDSLVKQQPWSQHFSRVQ